MPVQQINVKNSCDIEPGDWGLVPYAREETQNVRLGSSSSQSCSSGDICRICHCESDVQNPLLAPCYCSGSLKFVHQTCLQQWLTASETRSCELCKFPFIMHTKIKPFNEWRRLEMSGVERRRLCCAVLFHCVAALCVIWSLFVLIDRAAEEVQRGLIAWPFWTKLVVVAVGFTGGAVFMYIQCRQYLHLCNRWRAHNRILLIQNAPEKIHIVPPSPIVPRNVLRHPLPSALSNPPRSTLDHIANIENNPQNYELGHTPNWSLEEVNNMEEFELNSASVHSSKLDTSVYIPENTFMPPELRRTEQINSSVFLENKDILGDDKNIKQQSPKIQHRHSSILTSDTDSKLDDTRRYSDTKLLQSFNLPSNFNITKFLGAGVNDNFNSSKSESPFNFSYNQAQKEVFVKDTYDTSHTETPNASLIQPLSGSYGHTQSTVTGARPVGNQENTTINISKIIFESSTSFDPLELKIQELLELDIQTSRKKSVLSLNMKDSRNGYEKNKSLFKSLPNLLSASSENLLP